MEINMPENLSEVRLEQYQQFLKLIETKDLKEDYANVKIVSIFCDLDMDTVRQIKQRDILDIVEHVNNIFKEPKMHVKKFTHKGIEYGFIPNLDEITSGEYIDAEKYASDYKTYHKAMAVFYRPITSSFKNMYNIEKYKGSDVYSDIMKEVSVQNYLGAEVFFWNLLRELIEDMKAYSQSKEVQAMLKKHLAKNGGGMQAYSQQHKAMSLN